MVLPVQLSSPRFSVLRRFLEYDRNFHDQSPASDLHCGCLSTPSMAMLAQFKTFAVTTVVVTILTFLKLLILTFSVPFFQFCWSGCSFVLIILMLCSASIV